MTDVEPELTNLSELIADAQRVVGFTGAGVSTESGIPDFRSPDGVWSRYDPQNFEFSNYVSRPDVRQLAWEMRREFFSAGAQPNPAHRAFSQLEESGKSPGVITQNIDGLHQLAGSQNVLEIHGTAREVMCIGSYPVNGTPDGCGWRAPYTWGFDRVDAGETDPSCPDCGGLVKSATISFGQMLEADVIEASADLARSSDLMIVAGSSLQVYPAAAIPIEALDAGAELVIINDEPTPFDHMAALVIRGKAGEILRAAILDEGRS